MQVSGRVDQSAGMLDDEAKDKGYTLLCVSEPQEDCRIATIEEVGPGASVTMDDSLPTLLCSDSYHTAAPCNLSEGHGAKSRYA